MAALTWDDSGKRFYETGVDKGVLYIANADPSTGALAYGDGIAWNGLTAVKENPDGGDAKAMYADNMKYLELMAAEDYKYTIEAYTYPIEFAACDGTVEATSSSGSSTQGIGLFLGQQPRQKFGFCYRTKIGNDVTSEKGYKIHLVYGCLAAPSSRDYNTINDSPEAITFSWEVSTTPAAAPTGYQPSAHLVIDSTKADSTKLAALEDLLYGTASAGASLPDIATVISTLS